MRRYPLALLCAFLLLLSACGPDSSSGPRATSAPAQAQVTPAPTSTPKPPKLGGPQAECPSNFRTFTIKNTTSQAVWLGVNSGAQPAPASKCGPHNTCSVPGTKCSTIANPPNCYFVSTNPGENQACSVSHSKCPTGQKCNTSLGLCQWKLAYDYRHTCSSSNNYSCPANERCDKTLGICLRSSTIPKNDLEISPGKQKILCVPSQPSIPAGKRKPSSACTKNSQCASGQCNYYTRGGVQSCNGGIHCTCGPINPFSGGIFLRTDCQANGTDCQTGDCGNAPYQPCALGKGAGNPASQAEFTLSEYSQDYYDVTLINGANAAIQMVPVSTPAPAPTPAGAAPTPTPIGQNAEYWCKTPGSPTAQGKLPACPWDFKTTNVGLNGSDWTTLLTQISLPACKPGKISCPLGSSCQPNGSGTYYCAPYQDSSGACTTSSDCSAGWSCFSGMCLPYGQCTSYSDCPVNSACVNGLCDGIGCTKSSDCSSLRSATCLNETIRKKTGSKSAKVCVPMTCDSSVSCPAGFSCSSAGRCKPTQASCSLSNPCPAHQFCDVRSGECVTKFSCSKDGSCPLGYVCGQDNMCVKGGVNCTYNSNPKQDQRCPDNTLCPSSGKCPGYCSSDADCASVDGICNAGICEPMTWDNNTSCPSGYTTGKGGYCVLSCGSASDCADSLFGSVCGSGMYNSALLQTCGTSTGAVWTMDDFCGLSGKGTYGGVNCATTPSGGNIGSYADMFKCTGLAATSCYNIAAKGADTCCGCPTSPNTDSSSWPLAWSDTQPTMLCYASSPTWTNDIVPWLQYIKSACPTAYSFPFDDATSTFQCESNGTSSAVPNKMNYDIVFSPIGINATPSPAFTPTPAPTP